MSPSCSVPPRSTSAHRPRSVPPRSAKGPRATVGFRAQVGCRPPRSVPVRPWQSYRVKLSRCEPRLPRIGGVFPQKGEQLWLQTWNNQDLLIKNPNSRTFQHGAAARWPETYLLALRTVCYAKMVPGRTSGLRARFRPDSNRESLNFGNPADFEVCKIMIRPKFGSEARFPARSHCVT